MSDMFKPIDAGEENAILAAASQARSRRGPDFSIRTVSHWFTLPHSLTGECEVERHGENIPEFDESGNPYDPKRARITTEIEGTRVCRWCFIGSLDQN